MRTWNIALVAALAAAVAATTALASHTAAPIRIAVMTDCSGPFADGSAAAIAGVRAALAQYAGARPRNPNRPSAGIVGGTAGGRPLEIVAYGCGDGSVRLALSETERLMEDLRADVMIGPAGGDEGVAVAAYAAAHPTKTFVIGAAASQDPTLQIAPPNVFRYHADGAQRNAGLGQIAYKVLRWRTAAVIMDDNAAGWTSAAGMIADFCAAGGKIVTRLFAPPTEADYGTFERALPPPDRVDGYFWAVGGPNTGASLRAFEERYGPLRPRKVVGDQSFTDLASFPDVASRLVGAYVGGFGTAPGVRTSQAKAYEATISRWLPPSRSGTDLAGAAVYDYWNATAALVRGLNASHGRVGAALDRTMPRTSRSGYQVSNGGLVRLDANRQAVQDQYQLQVVRGKDGGTTLAVAAFVPGVAQSFGGLFTQTSPPPGRTQPTCTRRNVPWAKTMRVVKNGIITRRPIAASAG